MAYRRCPYCGEILPSFSLNCPKCYRSIPAVMKEERENVEKPQLKIYDRKMIMLLALVPAALGFAGMAQLYMRDYKKAGRFFFASFPAYASMVILISFCGAFSSGHATATMLAIVCLVLFLISYLIQAFDALISSVVTVSYVRNIFFK